MVHKPIGADTVTGETAAPLETRIHGWIDTGDALAVPLTQKGAPNGVATLDGGGKVPVNQLPSSVMEYKGVWNATTNTPTLADGSGNAGDTYRVTVAGTQNLGSGPITFGVGDLVIYDGSVWQKSDSTDAVTSVAGLTGTVTAAGLKTALSLPSDTAGDLTNLDTRLDSAEGTIATLPATYAAKVTEESLYDLRLAGLTGATSDIKTILDGVVGLGIRRILVPYAATAWPMLTKWTGTDVELVFAPGARINFNMDGEAMDLTRVTLRNASFTSPFTGPSSAADASPSGHYQYGARSVIARVGCVIDGYYQEYASAGIRIADRSVIGRNVWLKNIRQRQGWGAAIHADTTNSIYAHFTGIRIEDCDRAVEQEAGASNNTFERGFAQNIGPNGYTGQPVDYADYTFVLDSHSHTGEGSCQNNVYRDWRLYNCQGGITAIRSNGSNDSDLPRGNVWENIDIEGRVGTTGYQSVYVQGHGNLVKNLRLLAGAGVTSKMNVLIEEASTACRVEITEASGYVVPLVKVGTSSNGRGNSVSLKRVSDPASGSDWLVDVNHPDSTVELDVHNVVGSVGYCRLGATAHYSRILGYYSVASGTSMTQALRLAGPKDCKVDVVGIAGATGVLDVYATNSTDALQVNAQVDRASGVAVNFDSTTTGCHITAGSNFGGGSVTNAGTRNLRGVATMPVSPAGRYIALSGPSVGTALFSNGALRLIPFYLGASITIDRIGSEVTVIGDAACVVRLGIFNDAGGLPGSPLVDATIAGDAVAVAEATITAVTLQPGWYWVGGVAQGVTVTAPTVRTTSGAYQGMPIYGSTGANVVQSAQAGHTKTGVTGALSAFGTTPSAVTTAPRIYVRLA